MAVDHLALIATDPAVGHGQAYIRGTRMPVSVVFDCLADGMSVGEIVTEYPSVDESSVRAVAAYGARLAREELVPLSAAP